MVNNAILKALGIETLPLGETEHTLTQKVLRNQEVSRLAHILSSRAYALEALRQMTSEERAAVALQIGAVKPPAEKVQWGIGLSEKNQQLHIYAKVHNEESYFSGRPEALPRFVFRGESVPPVLAAEYCRRYAPMGFAQDGDLAAAARQPDSRWEGKAPDPARVEPIIPVEK